MNKKNILQSGFTLIELLVVVAIIGVLTAVLLVNLVGIRERAADTKKKADLNQMKSSLRLYYNDAQSYPDASGGNTLVDACGGAACAVGAEMNNGAGTIYMKSVPEYSVYTVSGDGEGFAMGVLLTNLSDQEAIDSATKCSSLIGTPVEGMFYICSD